MSAKKECGCACSSAPKVIFSCSGAADVGAIADQAARSLSRQGAGNMLCVAGISARVPGITKSTEAAAGILVIDGCPIGCARKTLELAGFNDVEHIQLGDLGFRKGATPVTQTAVAAVMAKGMEVLV